MGVLLPAPDDFMSGLCLTFFLFLPLEVFDAFIMLVATFACVVTSSFLFFSGPNDATSRFFAPFLAALVEADAVATPLVVAVVDGVAVVDDVAVVGDVALVDVVAVVDGEAICPSSTKLMSSVEVGALAPGLRDQVGCLNIWIGIRGGPHSTTVFT